jgi:acetyl esterase/lipase
MPHSLPRRLFAARTFAVAAAALAVPLSAARVARADDAKPSAAPAAASATAAEPTPMPLWPGVAPGDKGDIGEERDTTKPDPKAPPEKQGVIRLGNVSKPTITVFKPAADKDTGAAVVVCPGGGYGILAYNLEGTEICQWLNSVGVTGVLLKYRVPVRQGLPRHVPPLQDVQRAIGLVRQHAGEWKIDPARVGVLGFSAGGHLAAAVSNNYAERSYPAVDDADKLPCRPDFAVLVYPAYLVAEAPKVKGEPPPKVDVSKLAAELPVTKDTPPTFIAMTQDDPIKIENAYAYALALKAAKVPAELHVYAAGGHGYGLRAGKNPVSTAWPQRAAEWMGAMGWLKK